MEWLRQHKLACFGMAVLIGLIGWINLRPDQASSGYGNAEGISEIFASTAVQPPRYALHILFIGNSFTYVQNIPRQLAEIASSDPGNPTQFFIQSVTRGGIDLKFLWEDGKALQALRGNHWDYVVLQEQSGWAMAEVFVHKAYQYATAFNQAVKQTGARTLLYMTWVDKPGSHWYSDPEYSYKGSPDYMYKRLVINTYALADKLGATVVPVGAYWQTVLAQQPSIDLYQSDGHHQGVAGGYLSALVFYKTLTGRDVTKIAFSPPGITTEVGATLRAIVAAPLPGQGSQ